MRRRTWAASLACLAGLAAWHGGHAATAAPKKPRPDRNLERRIRELSPEPVWVEPGTALRRAEEVAAIRHDLAFLGVGDSMEPLYGHHTALVVRRCEYDEIKRGMTIVYYKEDGLKRAHVVIGEDARGYIVRGLANPLPDPLSVDESNLIGYVIAAFREKPPSAAEDKETSATTATRPTPPSR